jgi:predicted nucleic acid-binding protein
VITAVDTNVLLDLLLADREHGEASREAIREALAAGSLVASPVVWTEVATFFEPDAAVGGRALERLGVRFVAPDTEASVLAARCWQVYRADANAGRRVAAGFLIGGHALVHADRLLTRDRGFFRAYFEGLEVVDPSWG